MLDRGPFCGATATLCFWTSNNSAYHRFQSQGGFIIGRTLSSLACNDPQSSLVAGTSRRTRIACLDATLFLDEKKVDLDLLNSVHERESNNRDRFRPLIRNRSMSSKLLLMCLRCNWLSLLSIAAVNGGGCRENSKGDHR